MDSTDEHDTDGHDLISVWRTVDSADIMKLASGSSGSSEN